MLKYSPAALPHDPVSVLIMLGRRAGEYPATIPVRTICTALLLSGRPARDMTTWYLLAASKPVTCSGADTTSVEVDDNALAGTNVVASGTPLGRPPLSAYSDTIVSAPLPAAIDSGRRIRSMAPTIVVNG